MPRDPDRGYRAVASLFLGGKILGPFRYNGTRTDDPNDIVPHEHRRDLRGLFVFAAWLGHNDVKSLNSLDSIVKTNGIPSIRHYLIDFGATLGSDSFTAKSPRAGNQYLFAWKPAAAQFFSLGFYLPRWSRAEYPSIPAAGNFEWEIFDPEQWKPNYPIPSFGNRLPDDEFWAAKQVMAFTDEDIRVLVSTGICVAHTEQQVTVNAGSVPLIKSGESAKIALRVPDKCQVIILYYRYCRR